jgi:Tol biopolymer transport system component
MQLSQGARLGPYEIEAPLGAGGMGEVYRARDTRLGRSVALKVIVADGASRADRQGRFEREARAVAALSHPNILAIHDVGREGEVGYAVMELVEGETLQARIARGAIPWRKALEIAAAVADGLAAAHARGIVHRDVKPSNVMLLPDGRVKLLDFGLATLRDPLSVVESNAPTEEHTRPGHVVGTVGYMSPEQVAGRAVDGRSDVFSLGCTLHEMLTGQRPFARPTAAETMVAILNDDPEALGPLGDAPADLARVLGHSLEKSADARFQSALDLSFALRSLTGSGPALRAEALPGPATPAARPTRVAKATAAALLLAAGAGLGAWWAGRQRAPGEPLRATDLKRLTYDDRYSAQPAISRDGSLVAFASDRAGGENLDLWVQQLSGGDAIRLTRGDSDERQPSFSPDGSRLVFRSEESGGGLYTVPALGGEPRLLVAQGFDGRFSPDAREVAYWTGGFVGFMSVPGSYRTFVVPAAGGTPREIPGFTGARFPVWLPGGELLVVASTADPPHMPSYDLWIVPREPGRPATPTHAYERLRAAGATIDEATRPAGAWNGNAIVSAGGDLWAVALAESREPTGTVSRLIYGPGGERTASVSGDGVVAFEAANETRNIWSLPLAAETATVLGAPVRVTEGSGPHIRAHLAADGRTLAYFVQRPRPQILVRDLVDGRVWDLGIEARFGSTLSPDGTRVAYAGPDAAAYVATVRGGGGRKLCDQCEVGDWTRDGRSVAAKLGIGSASKLCLVDAESGRARDLVVADGVELNRPHLSPDDRWLAFRSGLQPQQVFVAPVRPGAPPPPNEWVAITSPEPDVRPCGWSPSGRVLYFFSSRDGFRCLYARTFDPSDGRPAGPEKVVRHLHNIRPTEGGGASIVSTGSGNAVSRDQLLLDYPVTTVNVWTLRLAAAP